MANIFPIDFEEKLTMAQNDFILFSDSEDWNKIKKAQYKNLKWEKGDKWDQWPQGIQGIQWPQGIQWETWPQWEQWVQGIQWIQWETWASINSAAFSGNDIVFGETDWSTVTLVNAKTTLTWPQWPTWSQWPTWPTWPQWPKWDDWEEWQPWYSPSASVVKEWDTATITITDENWTTTAEVKDWGMSAEVEDETLYISWSGGWGWGWSGNVVWPSSAVDGHLAVFDWATWKKIKDGWAIPTPTTVVDNLNSQSTTSALSANQWRILDWKIADMMGLGKFLSLWNSTTWLPISFPLSTPYAYTTWDYFIIEVTWTTNYKPTWSSYTGTASSTAETDEVEVWDVYVYDWQTWLLQSNHWKTVTFANIAWNPTDNTNLANALSGKQDVSNLVTSVSSASTDSQYPSAKLFYDTCWDIETLINAL